VIATREQMLRVTRKANGEVVFKVSGQLTAENVVEMETLIASETKGRRIVLDFGLSGLVAWGSDLGLVQCGTCFARCTPPLSQSNHEFI
jgi:hypothetical protein